MSCSIEEPLRGTLNWILFAQLPESLLCAGRFWTDVQLACGFEEGEEVVSGRRTLESCSFQSVVKVLLQDIEKY